MAKFEVYIPASEPGGFNMTLKVGADNWMAALKAGMQKLGEQGAVSQNVMVDIQDDNSIHVTEAHSGRVFRIRELSAEEVARAQVKRPSQIRPAPRLEPKTDPAGLPPVKPAEAEAPSQAATLVGGVPAYQPPTEPPPARGAPAPPPHSYGTPPPQRPYRSTKSSPRIEVLPADVEELAQPVKPVVGNIGRARATPARAAQDQRSTEELLADIFLRVVELDGMASVDQAMSFVLDLAMEKVPCESGSVFKADGATGDLTFITARGPKASQVLASRIVIPAGTGIAGFCSAEGVSVAVSDVQKDPRFYAGVSEKVDYETRSLLCAPMMTHGRSFGCMQLINRKGGPQFQEYEVGVLAYLAHQAALYLNVKLLE